MNVSMKERGLVNTEVALTAFKGNCYKCGNVNTDIVKENVRRKMIRQEVRLGAMFYSCGKHGHRQYECELKKAHYARQRTK
jgi:hypothetical protein